MKTLLFTFVFIERCFVVIVGSVGATDFQSTLGHLKARTSPAVQANAALDLITRYVGEEARVFTVSVDPNFGPEGRDTFQITTTAENQIKIVGTTGVAVAWGFNYYLKNFCNSHIAWEGARVKLPDVVPQVNVTITSNDRFRYYQNVCTAGYSSAWWKWDQWEKNIDWMALNGINLALAFHAQEAIWQRVYLEMGLTIEEINEHFGGPAFLPWSRMGNIRGWGGPLTPSWHDHTLRLQKKILERMRDLGIIPVLPAFAGHVPRAFKRILPGINVTKIDKWNDFNDTYCCPFLMSPTDPLFKIVGGKFLKAYVDEFGTDHVYNCDTFNENEPQDSDLASLRNIGSAVFSAMTDVDPQAIWLMQGWLFVHDIFFWTAPRVEAFVTSVPIGRMIVLDLQSEQFPQYNRLRSYYGQPFIWCMLHNFGGTLGMFGSASIINKRPFTARATNGSTMIGTGLTPEGINQNYVIYELMSEMAYRKKPVDLDKWFTDYATRRYGAKNKYAAAAWRTLGRTIYNYHDIRRIRGHYVVTSLPTLKLEPWTWYHRVIFFSAWDNFTKARDELKNDVFYRHDLVDVTRQALQLIGDIIYLFMRNSYVRKDQRAFSSGGSVLLDVIHDMDEILASSENFLLGKWLRDAKSLATSKQEITNYEYNARNQITLWGPQGEIRDYANKQWSVVMSDFFLKRWQIFVHTLANEPRFGTGYNESKIHQDIFNKVEKPFTLDTKEHPVEPKGDCVAIALKLNEKWRKIRVHMTRKGGSVFKWSGDDSDDSSLDRCFV